MFLTWDFLYIFCCNREYVSFVMCSENKNWQLLPFKIINYKIDLKLIYLLTRMIYFAGYNGADSSDFNENFQHLKLRNLKIAENTSLV